MDPRTIQVVKSTAPVLAEHGTAITSRMYEIMFREHPQVKKLFNASHHQRQDGKKVSPQAASLAGAVYAFAAHVDELDKLSSAIPRIVNKHVTLNILPEHYPIVGGCILRSIKETLGDAATPEILDAWKEAYFFLADLLIKLESDSKHEFESRKGGWKNGFHKLVVAKKTPESQDLMSIHFKKDPSVEGENGDLSLPTFIPGQFLSVRFVLPTETLVRNYSISNAPGEDSLRISVKLDGKVSTLLHYLDVGAKVEIGIPVGDFVIPETVTGPVFLIHAGSGITPMMSIVTSMQKGLMPKRKVYSMGYHRNQAYYPFKKEIDEFAASDPSNVHPFVYYSQSDEAEPLLENVPLQATKIGSGRVSAEHFNEIFKEDATLKDSATYYLTGPPGYLTTVYKVLHQELGIPAEKICFEYFGPTVNVSP